MKNRVVSNPRIQLITHQPQLSQSIAHHLNLQTVCSSHHQDNPLDSEVGQRFTKIHELQHGVHRVRGAFYRECLASLKGVCK